MKNIQENAIIVPLGVTYFQLYWVYSYDAPMGLLLPPPRSTPILGMIIILFTSSYWWLPFKLHKNKLFGYQPNMNYKSLINILYLWLHTKPNIEICWFLFLLFLIFNNWNLPKSLHFHFLFWVSFFSRFSHEVVNIPYENWKWSLFIHTKSDYEIFIQAIKGYGIIGPMRT